MQSRSVSAWPPGPGVRFGHASTPVILVVVAYALMAALCQREWLFDGEMYAEMATNYFLHAETSRAATILFARDAGYWPLPQRVLAGLFHALGLRAMAIPYAYTWSALLGAGLLAGSFAHPLFRPLVRCDLVRVAAALLLLLSLDFETRGFINFTYLVVVFGAALAALVVRERDPALRWWCWLLPLLVLSKPHVLIVVPLAAIAAVLGRGRGRVLMLGTVAAGLLQAAVLLWSSAQGMMSEVGAPGVSLLSKLRNGMVFGFGLAGGDIVGPAAFRPGMATTLLVAGLAVTLFTLLAWWRSRAGGAALMLAGLGLMVGTGLLNALTLSTMWNGSLDQLNQAGIFRYKVTAIAGAFLFVAGAVDLVAGWLAPVLLRRPSGAAVAVVRVLPILLLSAWVVLTGSSFYPQLITEPTRFPLAGAGQWQRAAALVDAPDAAACVPLNPLGWTFPKRCIQLLPLTPPTAEIAFGPEAAVAVEAPAAIAPFQLLAVAVAVRPAGTAFRTARLRASVEHADGTSTFAGDVALRPDGAQVLLSGTGPVRGVRAIRLQTDTDLVLLANPAEAGPRPSVAWMGR